VAGSHVFLFAACNSDWPPSHYDKIDYLMETQGFMALLYLIQPLVFILY